MPALTLSLDDIVCIGIVAFHYLVQTKSRIEQLKKGIAYHPPEAINDPECNSPLHCDYSWKKEWWNGLAKFLLHPDAGLMGHEILAELEKVKIPGMCDACQTLTVAWIKEWKVFLKDEEYISDTISNLTKMQTDEPIRASLRQEFQFNTPQLSRTTLLVLIFL